MPGGTSNEGRGEPIYLREYRGDRVRVVWLCTRPGCQAEGEGRDFAGGDVGEAAESARRAYTEHAAAHHR